MAAKKTAPPIDIDTAITNALAEQEAIEQERSGLLAKIDQLQSELSSIHNNAPNRTQAREALKVQIAATQQHIERQEEYISLWQGNAGTRELVELKTMMEALLDRLHQAVQNDEQLTTRCAELDAAIAKDRTDLAGLDRRISTVSSARQRLISENSANVYDECSSVYQQRLRHEQECRDALAAAEDMTATARGASLQRLSQWPEERRRFEAQHRLNDDATSETLQASVTFLDELLRHGTAMEQQLAGSVCVQVWYELVLDAQTLRALADGDTAPLRAIRDRQYSLLYDYRAKQARV